jgi:hypothetical protein
MKRTTPEDKALIEGMLKEGDSSNKQIAEALGGRVNIGTIGWMRSELKKNGNGKSKSAARVVHRKNGTRKAESVAGGGWARNCNPGVEAERARAPRSGAKAA